MNPHAADVLLHGLNPEQRAAVESSRPKMLVIAGAGTGKTHVLARRVARLIALGVPPELILAVTFTRPAAAEMRERIGGLLEQHWTHAPKLPEVATLHAWGAGLIRRYPGPFGLTRDFSIYDEVDREDVIRACAADRGIKGATTAKLDTLWKEEKVRRLYAERLLAGNAIDFDSIEAFTLTLLTTHPDARREWTHRYRHVLVDEYQDTNLAQVAIVQGIAADNVFVVGDPRQSIYRFRGAEVATIVDHARDSNFEVIELVTNYRSVPGVVEFGNGCVDGPWQPMNSAREAAPGPSPVSARTWRLEAPIIATTIREELRHGRRLADFAVLGRTWAAIEGIRDHFAAEGIPYQWAGDDEDVWNTEEGRAVARAVMLRANPLDDNLAGFLAEWGAMGTRRFSSLLSLRAQATTARRSLLWAMSEASPQWSQLLRVWRDARDRAPREDPAWSHVGPFLLHLGVLECFEGRKLTTRVARLYELIADLRTRDLTVADFLAWWNGRTAAERVKLKCRACFGSGERTGVRCDACGGTGKLQAVSLLTVHAAKGLEWPVVFGVDCRDGVFPTSRRVSDEDRAEDLRVFYVLATRARDQLVLTFPTTWRSPWGGPVEVSHPSPYLGRPGGPETVPWTFESWGGRLPASW